MGALSGEGKVSMNRGPNRKSEPPHPLNAQKKDCLVTASYPARPFSGTTIPSRYRESQFHPCPTIHLTLNVDSRVSGGLV